MRVNWKKYGTGRQVVGTVKKVGKSRNFCPKVGKSRNFYLSRVGKSRTFMSFFHYYPVLPQFTKI